MKECEFMEINIKKMEELGISDYYLTLTQYITNFINKNYPLSKEDMIAIVNNRETENIIKRNETFHVLKESMFRILDIEAEDNKRKLDDWNDGIYSPAITLEEQSNKIFSFIQQMLEDLWNYQNEYNNIDEQKKDIGR